MEDAEDEGRQAQMAAAGREALLQTEGQGLKVRVRGSRCGGADFGCQPGPAGHARLGSGVGVRVSRHAASVSKDGVALVREVLWSGHPVAASLFFALAVGGLGFEFCVLVRLEAFSSD